MLSIPPSRPITNSRRSQAAEMLGWASTLSSSRPVGLYQQAAESDMMTSRRPLMDSDPTGPGARSPLN